MYCLLEITGAAATVTESTTPLASACLVISSPSAAGVIVAIGAAIGTGIGNWLHSIADAKAVNVVLCTILVIDDADHTAYRH